VLRVLEAALRMNAQQTPTAEMRKILFVEKRRELLHSGECRRTWNLVIPWVSVGSGVL
jgi:hypothetical protein